MSEEIVDQLRKMNTGLRDLNRRTLIGLDLQKKQLEESKKTNRLLEKLGDKHD